MEMSLQEVLAARIRISQQIHKTPLLHSQSLSSDLGFDLVFKAEHLQKTGSFKARGASHFLARAGDAKVFTTYSSGNHGQAIAWASQNRGKQAVIFVPEDASHVKVTAMRGYGADVRFAGLTTTDRQQACEAFATQSGATVVPPYTHEDIVAGQGTLMLEVLEEEPHFDAVMIPVGGGGLLSGNSLVLRELGRRWEIFACEPALAADAQQSLASGHLRQIEFSKTIADGLRALHLGELNWQIIKNRVDEGLTCSEDQIIRAMGLLATYLKQYVEPSGAVPLACLLEHRARFQGKRVLAIISGGNIQVEDFARLVTCKPS